MICMTTTTPATGTLILVETKPFRNSDETRIHECRVLDTNPAIWSVERKPGSRHCIPTETIVDWTEA
jgi:hypothetical protein